MSTITRTIGSYHDSSHARIRKIGQYTGPSSYVTGGDPMTPGDLGMGKVELILFEPASDGTDLRLVRFDSVTNRAKWFDLAGAEIANGTDLDAYAARFEAIGY